MKIYKYALSTTGDVVSYKGKFRNVLSIGMNNENPYVWIENDEKEYEKKISIVALGTGQDVDDIFKDWKYLGTLTIHGCVWHYYYNIETNFTKEIEKLTNLLFGEIKN